MKSTDVFNVNPGNQGFPIIFFINLLIDIILFRWSFHNHDGSFSGSVYSLLKLYFQNSLFKCTILCHVDLLLGSDRKIGDCRVACKQQRNGVNRGMVFSAQSAKQQLSSNRGTVFSVWSMPRYYKQGNWSNGWL
jgi:hypothetical protein